MSYRKYDSGVSQRYLTKIKSYRKFDLRYFFENRARFCHER